MLVRADLNLPLDEHGDPIDFFRLDRACETLKYLISRKAKIVIISHLGDPGGTRIERFSLKKLQPFLQERLRSQVVFLNDCIGEEIEVWTKEMREGEVLLLENLRFHSGEKANDIEFSKALSKLGDLYINDAFSVSHREHASIVGVPLLLESMAGLFFEKEYLTLKRLRENSSLPRVLILGGAKSSKLKNLKELLSLVDFVLIGGKHIERVLRAKGIMGRDENWAKILKDVSLTDTRLRLPLDVVVSPPDRSYIRISAPAFVREREEILDIGPETKRQWSEIIKGAGTIIWAGPVGKVEEREFAFGSVGIIRAVSSSEASDKIAGGSDTISFLSQNYATRYFTYLSGAGGAMVEFLAKGDLPGIRVLEKRREG